MVAEPTVRRSREWQWTATGWERLHRLALFAMLASAFALAFMDGSERGLQLTLFFTILSGAGIAIARLLEPALSDFLRGLSPRDCVLYFLVHGAVLAIPGFMGFGEWSVAVAALIAFICFVAIDKLGFGRLHAASLILVIIVCASEPLPQFDLLAVWLLLFLVCYRLEHLSGRLSRFGEGRAVPVFPAMGETIVWLVLPWIIVIGLFWWVTPQMAPHTRFLVFDLGARTPAAEITRDTSMETLVRDLFILALLVGALAFVVWWFERRLGLRRRGRTTETGVITTGASSIVRSHGKSSGAPVPDLPRDARGRILTRFKALSEAFSREGWGRERSETAGEYLRRVWMDLSLRSNEITGGLTRFHRACYSPSAITEDDAEVFAAWAGRAESEVHTRAEQRRKMEAEPGNDAMP